MKPLTESLSPQQVLVLGFAGVIALGAYLLTLPITSATGEGLAPVDALFTATSAVCVTGLVVVDTGTHFSSIGKGIILVLIQVGGLGFMTFSTLFALLMGRKITFRERLLLQEAMNKVSPDGVVRLVKYVTVVTLVLEGAGALLLFLYWLPRFGWPKSLYYGVFHAVSAFNNAGFDLMGQEFGPFSSLTAFTEDAAVTVIVSLLVILGGLGFAVIADLYRQPLHSRYTLHTRMVLTTTAILIAAATVLFFLLERSNPSTLQPLSFPGKVLASYFQAITPRTAGFNTIDIADLRPATQFLEIVLMFIGASPGSTGGGIKTTTFAALALAVGAVLSGNDDISIRDRRLPGFIVAKAMAIAVLAMALVVTVTMILSITEKADFLTVLFESTSAFGTVGLSMGLTPSLSLVGKIVISFTMFSGRLGPVTLALALAQRRRQATLHFPEEKILVG
ncbi:ATP synthase subunit J [Clostridiales bacterium PH28_bin88]|nr:ATP synthase subunit J [Clostridiales bacterium PH28_bin88]